VHAFLRQQGAYRLLVCPDHPTFLRTKTHSHGYVPFAMCGSDVPPDTATTYDELSAAGTGLVLDEGFRLMDRFLQQR
jgi:2,3-bisphosphoglycerate-independent phosphoglycerate mutase